MSGFDCTGYFLTFYLIPVAALYSATQVKHFYENTRCLNGHHASPLAKFCEECGAAVVAPDINIRDWQFAMGMTDALC
jgi:hypothetical protein